MVSVAPNDFCKEALQPKLTQLPNDCVQQETNSTSYKIHECLSVRCRNYASSKTESCRDENNFCCSMKDFQIVEVNCSNYIIELVDVTSCECGACTATKIFVSVTATGRQDGAPVKFGSVYVNGDMEGYTNEQGTFEFSIEPLLSQITINIQDNVFNDFLPAIKVIKFTDVMADVMKVEVKMVRAAYPIKINSSVENILHTGSSGSSNVSNILLAVPANAFYFENGSQYSGNVQARLTYLEPSNMSAFDDIPGTFEYIDEKGEVGRLASLGVFNIYFEDTSGNPLIMAKIIDAYIPLDEDVNEAIYNDFKLWSLNFETGIWEIERNNNALARRKRDSLKSWVGALADVSREKWYNYDEVYQFSNSSCYFKFDLYGSRTMNYPVVSLPKLNFEIFIIRDRVANIISHYTGQKNA